MRLANGPKLLVKVGTVFSLKETLKLREAHENKRSGNAQVEAMQDAIDEEHEAQLNEKDKEIRRIKAENQRLVHEANTIEDKMKKPDEQTLKSSAENQELEKAKEYYLSKNVEIE